MIDGDECGGGGAVFGMCILEGNAGADCGAVCVTASVGDLACSHLLQQIRTKLIAW